MPTDDKPPPRRRGRPPAGGTNPRLSLRIDRGLQDAFKRTAGTGWPKKIRAFMAWYIRAPGAELPQRPEPPEPE